MDLQPGTELLHYRIVEKLGEGGMGVVWKALDLTLDRPVAIKLLPEPLAADAERLGRFEREAKTLASLNHPHIAGIFGFHNFEGTRFLAMEYVEGEDLSERLKSGVIPLDEAVSIARAVADALSAAHARGVIHRDLKPANVMLTPGGEPRVLDFGLAKAVAPDGSSGSQAISATMSPTITSFGTAAHVILGTAAYMAPEQARGRAVDRRADIWALGALLFEMLTGTSAFGGETVSDTLASVLKLEPEWDDLPAGTPPAVRRLLRRCLQKDPKHRLHDAADARIELEHAFDEQDPVAGSAPTPRASAPFRLIAAVASAALIGGLLVGFALRGSSPSSPPTGARRVVSSVLLPDGVVLDQERVSVAVSPDGDRLAFVGVDQTGVARLHLYDLSTGDSAPVPGTERARTPFWSPDSRELGYLTETRLMRVAVEGGSPREVAEINGSDGSWAPDGTILIGTVSNGPLMAVNAEGGKPRPVEATIAAPGVGAESPAFLPDGEHFVFELEDLEGERSGIYLARLGAPGRERIVEGLTNCKIARGRLLYIKDNELMAWRLDPESMKPVGQPQRIAGPVLRQNYPFHGFFSAASHADRLVYVAGEEAGRAEIVWVDRTGTDVANTGIEGDLYNPELSNDERLLALDVSTPETHGDIWIFDLARGSSRRLTDHHIDESKPTWTPDDEQVVFFRVPDLYSATVSGSGEPRLVYSNENQKIAGDISPDGRWLVYWELAGGDSDLWVVELETGQATPWLATGFSEATPRFSPDGSWITYESDESGANEIYLDRFPNRGERFRISSDGGTNPRFSRDGTELYYYSPSAELMAVPVDMSSRRDPIGTPRKLFAATLRRDYYDVSADGERFLLNRTVLLGLSSAVLVQNWTEEPGE